MGEMSATFKAPRRLVKELKSRPPEHARHRDRSEGVGGKVAAGCSRPIRILANPRKPCQQLLTDLEFVCDELYTLGDAIKPRSMHNAIREGYLVGIRI
jgi:hypothetical protein